MSFGKAEQLLSLAALVSSEERGITLDDVMERFSVSKRTAQRMVGALPKHFPETTTKIDEAGRKRWSMPSGALRDLMTLSAHELAALDLAIAKFVRSNLAVEADELSKLRQKIIALVPRTTMTRLETDLDALLEAQGLACRPGPRQKIDRKIAAALTESIKAGRLLEIDYQARDESAPRRRTVAPYGLLTGIRRYLVGRPIEDAYGPVRLYVVAQISKARVSKTAFERDPSFDLQTFARRAFGVFQNADEFGEVVWRFRARAAARAREFEFHPTQVLEDKPDGSLIVRFRAAGYLEMAWHLYMWGKDVEVLAPPALKNLVEGHRRSDFPALP